MYDIITVGEILVEILAEKKNQKFDAPGLLLGPYPSGAPAISIDQAGRMGSKCAIIAKIGDDDFGKLNIKRLAGNGVDVSHIITTQKNSTGTAFVTYFDNGERQFIFHFGNAACGELEPKDINPEIIAKTKFLHIMGCSITASISMQEAIMKAVRIAIANKVKISFDPNIRPELLKGNLLDHYNEIMNSCDILLTGKNELNILFNNPGIAIKKLLNQKDRIIIVKNGSKGTNVYTRTKAFQVDTFPAKEVDPTGAGDCFDTTFLSMLCQGEDLEKAIIYANAAGALAVQVRGPMEGNSNKFDIENYINENKKIFPKKLPIIEWQNT